VVLSLAFKRPPVKATGVAFFRALSHKGYHSGLTVEACPVSIDG